MGKICIPKSEFEQRLTNIRKAMAERKLDAFFVYGDEYRKENLRYVSNYWPIFERGGMLCAREGAPIVLCAPEGEQVAKEMRTSEMLGMLPELNVSNNLTGRNNTPASKSKQVHGDGPGTYS